MKNNFWIDMALSVIFSVLKQIIKNGESKEDMRAACLKLYNTIKIAYSGDPDFE